MGVGDDRGKLFYRKGDDWLTEDKARELEITNSTLPTKSKKVKK